MFLRAAGSSVTNLWATCKVPFNVGQLPGSHPWRGATLKTIVVNSCASWILERKLIHVFNSTWTAGSHWKKNNIVDELASPSAGARRRDGMGGYQDIMWPRSAVIPILWPMATIGLDTTYSRIHNTRKKVEYASTHEEVRIIIGLYTFVVGWKAYFRIEIRPVPSKQLSYQTLSKMKMCLLVFASEPRIGPLPEIYLPYLLQSDPL